MEIKRKPVSNPISYAIIICKHERSREAKQYVRDQEQRNEPPSNRWGTAKGQRTSAPATCERHYCKRRNLNFIIAWMSMETNYPGPPTANRSFVLSESTKRVTARLSETSRAELDSVRRDLESQYPRREVESPNVVVEREFLFNNIDESLLVTEPTDPTTKVRRNKQPRISRTSSNIVTTEILSDLLRERDFRSRRSVSAPEKRDVGNAHSSRIYVNKRCCWCGPRYTSPGHTQTRAANHWYGMNASTETWRDGPHRHIRIIEMRTEMHSLNERVRQVENINRNATRRETNDRELSIAWSDRDIRHRRSTTPNFFIAKRN